MPFAFEITVDRRRPKTYRRALPASWTEVEPARRFALLQMLFRRAGDPGRLDVLQHLLDLPRSVFLGLLDADVARLLDLCAWFQTGPDPTPILPAFVHQGVRYFAPLSHGLNLVALEYPIADEAFGAFLRSSNPADLALLVATLYREANPDADAVITRGDVRTPLRSRWEAEYRAKALEGLDDTVAGAVLLYFAGVKLYVHQAYGKHLFEQPEEDDQGNAVEMAAGPSMGWWGVYFNVATDGPFGRNVEDVYQTSFHDVCLYLVDRKRTQDKLETQRRMKEPDFGIDKP